MTLVVPILYTQAWLEDKLAFHLLSFKNAFLEEDEDGNEHIRFYYPYEVQAKELLYTINVSPQEFVIFVDDLPQWLVNLLSELKKNDEVALKKLVTNVIRRIYEDIDEEYYRTNGIYSRVCWRFGKPEK